MSGALPNYTYRSARALLLLHERELRHLIEVWRKAKAANIPLPVTDDPDYESLDHLLFHILRAARGYMTWMCEQLGLPDPQIDPPPSPATVDVEAELYAEYLLNKWRTPLAEVPEERFSDKTYASRWGVHYCIDAMLEHAVVHPLRHAFQLEELLNGK
ncbi:MAG: hypothetical protein ACOZB3_08045 [Calditrichota bacterium]